MSASLTAGAQSGLLADAHLQMDATGLTPRELARDRGVLICEVASLKAHTESLAAALDDLVSRDAGYIEQSVVLTFASHPEAISAVARARSALAAFRGRS